MIDLILFYSEPIHRLQRERKRFSMTLFSCLLISFFLFIQVSLKNEKKSLVFSRSEKRNFIDGWAVYEGLFDNKCRLHLGSLKDIKIKKWKNITLRVKKGKMSSRHRKPQNWAIAQDQDLICDGKPTSFPLRMRTNEKSTQSFTNYNVDKKSINNSFLFSAPG